MTFSETLPLLHPTPSSSSSSSLFGLALMLLSALCHSLMSFLLHLSQFTFHLSPSSAILIRGILEFHLTLSLLLSFRPPIPPPTPSLPFRGLFAALSMYCQLSALQLLPVGDAVTIFFSNPAITMLFCSIFLSEPSTALDLLCLLLSTIGVLLVSKPSFLPFFPDSIEPLPTRGIALAIAGAVLNAGAATLTRKMGGRVHFLVNGFGMGVAMLGLGVAGAGWNNLEEIVEGGMGVVCAVVGAVVGAGSQVCMNRGLQKCRPGPGLLVRGLSIVFSYVWGVLWLGEGLGVETVMGVMGVMAAGVIVAWKEVRKDKEAQIAGM